MRNEAVSGDFSKGTLAQISQKTVDGFLQQLKEFLDKFPAEVL